jgi:hypothetical protein
MVRRGTDLDSNEMGESFFKNGETYRRFNWRRITTLS